MIIDGFDPLDPDDFLQWSEERMSEEEVSEEDLDDSQSV
jgi:hypothetical protein